MPRKLKVSLNSLVEIIKLHEEIIFREKSIVVGPTHPIWEEVSRAVGQQLSAKSIYTMLKCNRNNILSLLGIVNNTNEETLNSSGEDKHSSGDSSDSKCSIDEKIKFNITLSIEEWEQLKTSNVLYNEKRPKPLESGRVYNILKPKVWPSIIQSHFWEQTKLPCSISYKRAKIFPNGANYCTFVGYCTACESEFTGVLENKPSVNARAIFLCCYEGDFRNCNTKNKRNISINQRKYFVDKLVNNKLSSVMVRRMEADNIMLFGDKEPSHLPTSNALRIAKCRALKNTRGDDDPIMAIIKMKNIYPYFNIIKDIGYDRFFVHYWSSAEMNVYRKYVSQNKNCSSLSIDATGSLVKKPILMSNRKTKHILLYEIAILDKKNNVQYSVSHMLSERHDNNSIYHWLVEWIRDGAPPPKQVTTDMSLALLSAVVKSFTQYNSLTTYIQSCFKILDNPFRNTDMFYSL